MRRKRDKGWLTLVVQPVMGLRYVDEHADPAAFEGWPIEANHQFIAELKYSWRYWFQPACSNLDCDLPTILEATWSSMSP